MGLGSALIAAGGSILGSLFGKSKQQYISSGQELKSTVKAARELGIHPLAALGSGASYTPLPVYNNPIGPAVSKAADEIAKIPEQQMNKEVTASQIEVNKAQAELLRQQGTAVQAEVVSNLRNGTTGARNVSNPEKSPALFTTVTGEKGQQIRLPDMQVASDLETNAAAQLENGTFLAWVERLFRNNAAPLSYLTRLDKYVMQQLKFMSPDKADKLRAAWEAFKKKKRSKAKPGWMDEKFGRGHY